MIFTETPLPGVFIIDLELRADERGHFARTFCTDEYRAHGLEARVSQINTSHNRKRHTLRGLHYQADPHGEAKSVRCVRGAVYDVAVDLHRNSPTYRRWFGIELTAETGRILYVPPRMAHGFLTLVDDTVVEYVISVPYAPEASRGVRWDDPAFSIDWPARPEVMSARDASFPDLPP